MAKRLNENGSQEAREAMAAAAQPLEWLNAAGNNISQSMMEGMRSCFERTAAINGEVMEFAAQRWQRDIDLGQSLARCGDLSQAINLQQAWAKTLLQDYLQEASKLMQLTTKVAMESWTPVLRQGAETARNTPPAKQPYPQAD